MTLDTGSADFFDAALAAGYGSREAARIGRLGAVVFHILDRAPAPMGVAQLQDELSRLGVDPCARVVLERVLDTGLAAGSLMQWRGGAWGTSF